MIFKRNTILLLLLVILTVILQGIFTQKVTCDRKSQFCLTVSIPNVSFDPKKTYALFRMEAPSTVGWMAIGIGRSMIGSYMVMAWPRADGGVIISQRIAKKYVVPKVTKHQDDIILDPSSGVQGNKFVVLFRRPLSVNGSLITTDTTNYIWAIHDAERPDENSKTKNIEMHNALGQFSVVIDTTNNVPTDSTTTKSPYSERDTFIFMHGLLMFMSWGFIVPGGVFIVRFGRNILPKRWFTLHWGLQALGALPLSIFGIVMTYLVGVRFNIENRHHIIGAVLTFCFVVQLLIGTIHHRLYSPERKSIPWWTKVHWWFGRFVVILALVQIPIGLNIFNASKIYINGYYAYAMVLIISYIILSFAFWRRRENEIRASGHSNVSYTGVRQDDADFESLLTTTEIQQH